APGINANVNFHDEVAEAAGIRLGLMRRVRRNEQPVAGFYFIGLCTDDRLAAVLPGDDAVLILKILPVGDFSAEDHFARAPGENIEIIGAAVLLGVVKDAVDFGQAADGLVAIHAVQHKHAEVASLGVRRAAAQRLGTSAAGSLD